MNPSAHYSPYRWFVLLTLVLCIMAQGAIMIAPAPVIAEIAKSFGITLGRATGSIMGLAVLITTFSSILGGILNDKFGIGPMLVVSSLLLAVSSLLVPSLATGFSSLMALRVIQAMAVGPCMAAMSKVAALWFPEPQRPMATGLASLAIFLGIGAGLGLAPVFFAKTGSWPKVFVYMALVPVLSLIASLVVAFGPKPPSEATGSGLAAEDSQSAFRTACGLAVTWLGVIVLFFGSWTFNAATNLLPTYFSSPAPVGMGLDMVLAGKLMVVLTLGYMVGSLLCGPAVSLFRGRIPALLAVCYLVPVFAFTALILPVLRGQAAGLAIALGITGFCQGIVVPAAMAFIASSYPTSIIGRINGLWMGLSLLGGSTGIFVAASTVRAGFTLSLAVVSVVLALGFFMALFIRKPLAFQA